MNNRPRHQWTIIILLPERVCMSGELVTPTLTRIHSQVSRPLELLMDLYSGFAVALSWVVRQTCDLSHSVHNHRPCHRGNSHQYDWKIHQSPFHYFFDPHARRQRRTRTFDTAFVYQSAKQAYQCTLSDRSATYKGSNRNIMHFGPAAL